MRHVMLDLETWGTTPGSALRSIGAVEFDLDGRTGETFYANISRVSCEAAGLTVDPGTEKWWSEQSTAARKALDANPVHLREALRFFATFVDRIGAECVWGQGSDFDCALLAAAYRACLKSGPPWKFYNTRDTRTVYDVFGFDTRTVARIGEHHNALDDAVHQVRCVAAAIAFGRKPVAMIQPAPEAKRLSVFD